LWGRPIPHVNFPDLVRGGIAPMPRLNGTPWVWVYCANYRCSHARAVALTPWAIRWDFLEYISAISGVELTFGKSQHLAK
jgi:hypothetical protein